MDDVRDTTANSAGADTGLAVPTDLGKGLIEAAQEANRKTFQTHVVGKVQDLLTQLQKQRQARQQIDENIALLEAKARAIEAGAFSVTDAYGLKFKFVDPALDRGVVSFPQCPSCGYSREGRVPPSERSGGRDQD